MKRISALAGMVVVLVVSAAPVAQAAATDDVCQTAKQVLHFRFGC